MLRTHDCGELTVKDVSGEVCLAGWISASRDHGEIIFMDLRDKHGITQIVFDPEKNKEAHKKAHELRIEYCVRISGQVSMRPEGTVNEKIPTGAIEVEVAEIEVFSESLTPPFEIRDSENTVIIVEHDEDTIRGADYVIDLGPGGGRSGGWMVAQGTPQEIQETESSLTGAFLSGRRSIPLPPLRRRPKGATSVGFACIGAAAARNSGQRKG